MELAEVARDFALLHLKPEGAFLVKIFQGTGYDDYLRSLRRAFQKVVVRKPDASRGESAEQFLLARNLRPADPSGEGVDNRVSRPNLALRALEKEIAL
jgi:23S rRNA (uridine2552-2'-O)-methyltransferase